ncbi:DNA-directed DNA polymerase [Candidatus Woesearchaeota archaeon]|nr:DNA-directed DNA polymerase [Candidatus Woesearchaeota archaeon]MBW3006500.1 DNA-directed DNA polymerase [Candidatus Woesearchaeota archaeon]
MPKFQFYLLDLSYKIVDGKPVIYLFGKTTEGQQICVLDDSFEPYFYVIPKSGADLKEKLLSISVEKDKESYQVTRVEPVKMRYFEKEVDALRVFTNVPMAVPNLKDVIYDWDNVESVHEYDIRFVRRYLIDKGITPLTLLSAEGEAVPEKLKIPAIKADKIEQVSDDTIKNPRILAFDIETAGIHGQKIQPEKTPIIMIALYGDNFKRVITWKKFKAGDYVEVVPSEADLLQRFAELVDEYKPDFLAGYFSDGFDFPFIKARAKKYKLDLELGLDYSEVRVSRGTPKTAQLAGIVHFDVFKFVQRAVRKTLKTDSYKLDAVAEEILGEKKIDVDLSKLAQAWSENSEELGEYARYNLHDARLTYKLCINLLPNFFELVKVVGLHPYAINRMSFSQFVEWYIMRQVKHLNEIAPNRPSYNTQMARQQRRLKGAFVFQPTPGLYKDIIVFDYRSLYPTIIASHNISPGTHGCECCEGKNKAPIDMMNVWFCTKKKGFASNIIEDLISRRSRIKEILKEKDDVLLNARSWALKDLANSFWGYLGFSAARWYCVECAESILGWARYYIKDVIDKAEKSGFKVLYSDTDSVFIALGEKDKKDALKFVENINRDLPGMMELEYQGFYPGGIWVSTKSSESGAKKKYALLDENNKVKIAGFETVRRNWSFIAKDVQKEVLGLVLREQDASKALSYVRKVVDDLKNARIPVEKVAIHTQLSKDIDDYDSIGPHVAAAQRMKSKGMAVGPGILIEYVVTKGAGRIRDKVKLPDEIKPEDYDADYYIDHQIIPGVEKIFSVLGVKKEEILKKGSQSTLGSFV